MSNILILNLKNLAIFYIKYFSIHNLTNLQFLSLQEVTTRRQNTVVNIFYEDFEDGETYCVELKATQKYAVNEAVKAGIKVYDYNNKGKLNHNIYC